MAEKKTESKEVAPAQPTAATQFERDLQEQRPKFLAALPDTIDIEKFERVIVTAINNNPELWTKADRRSLYNSCVQAATDGLLPDGREGALVIFNTKVDGKYVALVQWMPMIYGLRKRMRNSGEVNNSVAHVVYGNDRFKFFLGDDERIEHEPALQDRGELVGSYAIIKLKNGEVIHEYMSRQEIDEIRAASKAPNSPAWKNWYGEMARKSVLRRAAKAAPMESEDVHFLIRSEDYGAEPPTVEGSAEPIPDRPERGQIEDQREETEGEGADDDVPAYEFIDRFGEVRSTLHTEREYLEDLLVEMQDCKVPAAVLTVWDHNEDAVMSAGEALDEQQTAEWLDPVYDAYNAAREAADAPADDAAPDDQNGGDDDEAASESEEATDLTTFHIAVPLDDSEKPKWMVWYNEVVKAVQAAEKPASVDNIFEANKLHFEDMQKAERVNHRRLMSVLERRRKKLEAG